MKSSILRRFSLSTSVLVSLVTLLLCRGGQTATLDVAKYGAVANDSSDAAAGIQAAMNAAKDGDEVYLPAGTYRISKSLVPLKNTKIYGAGIGKTVLLSAGPAAHGLISMGSATGIEITQLTLDGGGAQGLATDGIRAEICDHLYLHDLAIQNIGPSPHVGNGVFLPQKVTDSRFENCTFTNIGVDNRWSSAFRIRTVPRATR